MTNPAVKYGLYYAAASVITTLLAWLINKGMLFSGSFFVLGTVMMIFFMLLSNRAMRADQEGFLSFGEGIRSSMLTLMIGSLIGSIFTWVLMTYIDPSLIEVQKEVTLEASESLAEMLGASEEMLDEMKDEMEDAASLQPTLGQTLLGWGVSLVFPGLIIAMIVSAITKKND